jgi:hypothetical protein
MPNYAYDKSIFIKTKGLIVQIKVILWHSTFAASVVIFFFFNVEFFRNYLLETSKVNEIIFSSMPKFWEIEIIV